MGFRPPSVAAAKCAHGRQATYSYLANSPLVQQIVFANNGTTRMTTTKQYDYVNRLTQISSVPSQASTLSFAYAYNAANQRTNLTLADSSYWVYAYDSLGQVTSGKKYWSDATPVAGHQFQYQFDTIGNRAGTDVGGDQNGANLRHASYNLDGAGLNQYVSRDVPGYVQSLGTASASASVALWTASRSYAQAARKGTYFRAELAVANGSAPLSVPLTNIALLPGGASADVLSTAAGSLFVPKSPETFGYDADGNLTNDGHWRYTWDAENRLVRMTNYTGVGPQQSLTFEYDWRGRRIHKQVSANGTMTNNATFVYDGWNPIAQLNATNSNVIQSYVWGLDLSGSEQGAGGVGGLLEVNDTANGVHFAAYDGNGNVAGLVKASDGTSSAVYEYGPFGELIRATGPMARANPFRFSTKYQDDETDLLYYGYRYYNPSTGRWPPRDPIEEAGGPNLYGFVGNDPLTYVDSFGLTTSVVGHSWRAKETFGHASMEVYRHGYGFGPKDPHLPPSKLLNTIGKTDGWETTPTPRTTWPLYVRTKGQFMDRQGGKCCEATPGRIVQCAEFFKKTWDNTPYKALTRNCRDYVKTIIKSCCLLEGPPELDKKGE